jgi:hypothetical protein
MGCLGHSSITVTLNAHGHRFPSLESSLAADRDRTIWATRRDRDLSKTLLVEKRGRYSNLEGSSKALMVEMLGRYPHLSERGKHLKALLEMTPKGSQEEFPRPPRRVIRRLSSAQIEEMVASYAASVRISDLVEQFQADQTTIQKYVRQAGLPRRIRRLGPTKVDDVIRLYAAHNSVEAIAEYIDVAPTTVRRTLTKAGIPMRSRGRPASQAKDTNCTISLPLWTRGPTRTLLGFGPRSNCGGCLIPID